MPAHALFPTYVYTAPLQASGSSRLNGQLLDEAAQLRIDDAAGRRWSRKNYIGGYTSYASAHRLHQVSPTFKALERKLARHIAAFARTLQWDLTGRELTMTDCWLNIMARHTVHGLHLHPLSTVSGTYYVRVPTGSSGIKFEDPRLDRFMGAPPRRPDAARRDQPWVTLPATTGTLVLFESWLRHEVIPNPVAAERVSVSFNYSWF